MSCYSSDQEAVVLLAPDEFLSFEDPSKYTRGIFYPIVLGDILPHPGTCLDDPAKMPRYRIMHKLGWGGFGTVWLARDLDANRWVAVKVRRAVDPHKDDHAVVVDMPISTTAPCASDASQVALDSKETDTTSDDNGVEPSSCSPCKVEGKFKFSNEARILRHVQQIQQRDTAPGSDEIDAGSKYIVETYDSFAIRGPLADYECLVTEVVVPVHGRALLNGSFDPEAQRATKQLLAAFAFLHGQGIVHGDPSIDNIGVALPNLDQLDEDDVLMTYTTEKYTPWCPLLPTNRHLQPGVMPAYLTDIFPLRTFLASKKLLPVAKTCDIRVLDFGSAFWAEEPPAFSAFAGWGASMYHPPEVRISRISEGRMGVPWSKGADIWAVAALIADFHFINLVRSDGTAAGQFLQCCTIGGASPAEWLECLDETVTQETRGFLQQDYGLLMFDVGFWQGYDSEAGWKSVEKKWKHHKDKMGDVQWLDFINLLRRMVRTQPEERTPLVGLLKHRYVLGDVDASDLG